MGFQKGVPQTWHKRKTLFETFWPKVDTDSDAPCWRWTAAVLPNGYGVLSSARLKIGEQYAHRIAYTLLVRRVPSGMTLDHLCRNRWCVNPDHLEVVTLSENLRRGRGPASVNREKTHCEHGHEFTEANTYHVRGRRQCRQCNRRRDRARIRDRRKGSAQ